MFLAAAAGVSAVWAIAGEGHTLRWVMPLAWGLFCAALAADGLRRGEVDGKMTFDREEHPGWYWFLVALYSASAVAMVGVVLFL